MNRHALLLSLGLLLAGSTAEAQLISIGTNAQIEQVPAGNSNCPTGGVHIFVPASILPTVAAKDLYACNGSVGSIGLTGAAGPVGASIVGPKGDKGDPGASVTGPAGPQGIAGASIVGPQGPAGATGSPGADAAHVTFYDANNVEIPGLQFHGNEVYYADGSFFYEYDTEIGAPRFVNTNATPVGRVVYATDTCNGQAYMQDDGTSRARTLLNKAGGGQLWTPNPAVVKTSQLNCWGFIASNGSTCSAVPCLNNMIGANPSAHVALWNTYAFPAHAVLD